jgi:hypothetical protein
LVLGGLRIPEAIIEARQRLQNFRRSTDDPDRLAAPLLGQHLTGFDLADVHLDGRTEGACALARLPRCHERHGHTGSGHATDHRYARGEKATPIGIYIGTHRLDSSLFGIAIEGVIVVTVPSRLRPNFGPQIEFWP